MMDKLGGLAVGVAALAITLVIAFLVLSQGETNAISLLEATTTVNESTAWSNSSYTALDFTPLSITTPTCSAVYNGSGGALVASGNYTCGAGGIIFNGIGNTTPWAAAMLVTYTHTQPDQAVNATRSLASAVDTVPGWVPLIIICVVGGVLLALVALFRRRG